MTRSSATPPIDQLAVTFMGLLIGRAATEADDAHLGRAARLLVGHFLDRAGLHFDPETGAITDLRK